MNKFVDVTRLKRFATGWIKPKLAAKVDKVAGTRGQVLGFLADGNVVSAMDAPGGGDTGFSVVGGKVCVTYDDGT